MATLRYTNPVVPGFYPDPSVIRVGEDYYMATSSFEYMPGLPIFHSRNLTDWRQIGHALNRRSQIDLSTRKSSEGIYAPTLRYHQGILPDYDRCDGDRKFLYYVCEPCGTLV
ncbi:family 43 glycosylhydrolase [Paenibacillus sp. BT-177]|uniref:family 43 glycosylhydrolase n=1 Tax=Paenibacillus sp. BT-177 TaxID=2986930 RepID=UPI003F521C7A